MKKTVVIIVSIMLVLALALPTLAVSTATTKSTKLEYVQIKYYTLGDKSKDTDLILDQMNKKLKETINATLKVDYISWGDWATKYPLIFASGDDFDAIASAYWSFYAQQAKKNGFMEITKELLTEYAPKTLKDLSQGAWDSTKVDGKMYMIPQGWKGYIQRMYVIRGDLRQKYGLPEIKKFSDYVTYLKTIAKNENDILAYNADSTAGSYFQDLFTQWNEMDYITGLNSALYKITDPKAYKIVSLFDMPGFVDFLKKMRDLKEAGCWSKSALSNTQLITDAFVNGKSASMLYGLDWPNGSAYIPWKTKHPTWKLEVFDSTEGKKVQNFSPLGAGVSIHNTSKNAIRFIMATELLKMDKGLNELVNQGIKGVHWDPVGVKKAKYYPAASNYNSDSFTWGFRSNKYQKFPVDTYKGFDTLNNSLSKRVVFHPLQSFNYDISDFKNENAAVQNVIMQYYTPLILGFVDPESGLATLKDKLKDAGYYKMLAECQSQADAYMKKLK
jgi:putative aldouronate transport system substrate-binding protein